MIGVTGLVVALLVAIHRFIGEAKFLAVMPRSLWLSGAGGAAVAYVFVYLLPRIGAEQSTFQKLDGEAFLNHVSLLAMTWLVVFYGLELMVQKDREEREEEGLDDTSSGVFWVHIGAFALYNGLIGYLLIQRYEYGLKSMLFYGAAIALHFVSNDFGLHDEHERNYDRYGRWLLTAAIVAGWALGLAVPLPEAATAALFAGGIVLNVLKEELPEKRESSFLPFVAGGLGFSALLRLHDHELSGLQARPPTVGHPGKPCRIPKPDIHSADAGGVGAPIPVI